MNNWCLRWFFTHKLGETSELIKFFKPYLAMNMIRKWVYLFEEWCGCCEISYACYFTSLLGFQEDESVMLTQKGKNYFRTWKDITKLLFCQPITMFAFFFFRSYNIKNAQI
jgi:hypothetical protein